MVLILSNSAHVSDKLKIISIKLNYICNFRVYQEFLILKKRLNFSCCVHFAYKEGGKSQSDDRIKKIAVQIHKLAAKSNFCSLSIPFLQS